MKISFSTLGCPEWSWEEMLSSAKDLGYNGIEIRGIENELYVPKAKPFSANNIDGTLARLDKLNLQIPCLTSSCYLFDRMNIDFYLNEGREYIDLASRLGIPYIRVLADANPEPGNNIDVDFAAANIEKLAIYAQKKDVMILVETNGIFADSQRMRKLLEKVDKPAVGVLWDVHHPFRFMMESVETTYQNLKDHIKFVHVKDSVVNDGKVRYRMMGYGDIPVKEALKILKAGGYDGYVSLEWVKRWCIDLEEPGIVFSHFSNYMKQLV